MRKWIPLLLVAAAVVVSLIAYPGMPERIPTHWNTAGEVDGWSSRFAGTWLMPLMMAVILVIFRVLPLIDPRRENYVKFQGAYDAMVILMMAFMLALHAMVLAYARGYAVPISQIVPAAVGAFFVAIGFLLPKAHPNWFIGIRTPWTMTSNLSWERTHRLGGTLFILTGVLSIIAAFVSPRAAFWVMFGCGTATVAVLLVYSFIVWKGDTTGRSAA